MLLFPGYSGDRGTHQRPSGEILIVPAQSCRDPREQFCISDCVTLCISFLLQLTEMALGSGIHLHE